MVEKVSDSQYERPYEYDGALYPRIEPSSNTEEYAHPEEAPPRERVWYDIHIGVSYHHDTYDMEDIIDIACYYLTSRWDPSYR
jgi:hypothetical protein